MNTFREKLANLNGLYKLNLSIPEEREYYLESIGGEDNLKHNFPTLYSSFVKSCKAEEETHETSSDKLDVYFESFEAAATQVETNENLENASGEDRCQLEITVGGNILDKMSDLRDASVPAAKYTVSLYGKIYDPASPRLPFLSVTRFFDHINNFILHTKSEQIYRASEFDDRALNIYFVLSVYDEDSILTPYVYMKEEVFRSTNNVSIIEDIELIHPRSKHDSTNEIRILYGRTAKNLSDPDYIYENNSPEAQGGTMHTIIPIKGKVTLKKILDSKDYYSFLELKKPDPGHALGRSVLSYDDKEWKIYRYDKDDEELYNYMVKYNLDVDHSDSNVEILRFDLSDSHFAEDHYRHYDWNHDIISASTDNKERICRLVGGFDYVICRKNSTGLPLMKKELNLQILSVTPDYLPAGRTYYHFKQDSEIIFIPPIHLWWGCYHKDTQFRMADGTNKRANQVQIGESMHSCKGKNLCVKDIISGYESTLIHLRTKQGHELQISHGHPMLLENGKEIAAEKLKIGNEILAEGHTPVMLDLVEVVPYDDLVYNFIFEHEEAGNYLLANQLYSGDFYAQNMLPFDDEPIHSPELQQLLDELSGLCVDK